MEFNVLLAAFAAKYGVEGLDGALRFLCVTFWRPVCIQVEEM